MNLMNKIIQSKVRNKKIIFIAVICILIIGIVGLLIFNTIDNSSAKSDNKGNTASKISNNVKEKDKQNEKEDFKGMIEEKNKDSDEETSVISKNSLNISKKTDDSVNSDKKSDNENKNNSPKSTKSNAETNNSTQKNNSNSSNKSNTSDKSNSSSSNSTNNPSGSVSKPSHEHAYNIPVTQKVHHDAVTKTETFTVVDQAAYDEPIYESHQVCKVCGKDFGKGENATVEAINHSVETGHSYHSTSIKVGTKHHDAITHQETKTIVVTPAYDEEKVTGYRCSCGKTKWFYFKFNNSIKGHKIFKNMSFLFLKKVEKGNKNDYKNIYGKMGVQTLRQSSDCLLFY